MRPLGLSAFAGVVLLTLPAVSTARANLGDTEAQCLAKYGAEQDVQDGLGYDQVGDRAATFQFKTPAGVFSLRATFLHGRVCHEMFSSADASPGLSSRQVQVFLQGESGGMTWKKGRSVFRTSAPDNGATSGAELWQRSDGAIATFWVSGQASAQALTGELELATKEYAQAQRFYDKQDGAH